MLDIPLTVDLTGPGVDAASVGPNPTNGVLTDSGNPGYLVVSAQIKDKDAGGADQSILTDAEAFLDPGTTTLDGGTGLQLIPVDGKLDSSTETVYGLIPISQIYPLAEGTHQVFVRGQDAAGNWGTLFPVPFLVDKTGPVLGTLSASPNPTNGAADVNLTATVTEANGLNVAEFWIGATDPGAGRGTVVPVSIVNGKAVATVSLAGIPSGVQRFNLRVQDKAGNWSNGVNTNVTVSRPNLIFASNFEPNSPAWSAATGAVSVTAAAAMRTPAELGSTQGLQVTLPGGLNNRASYLTDRSPVAETTYHAQFTFNANTLKPGVGNVLTLFEGRTAQGRTAFAIQYRINGTTGQLRTVMTRNVGLTRLTGAWFNLPSGADSVRLDWAAALQGSLLLKVNGVAAPAATLRGNNSTLRLGNVLLGVISGYSVRPGVTSGTAYFDTFISTRNTLP